MRLFAASLGTEKNTFAPIPTANSAMDPAPGRPVLRPTGQRADGRSSGGAPGSLWAMP